VRRSIVIKFSAGAGYHTETDWLAIGFQAGTDYRRVYSWFFVYAGQVGTI